MEDTGWYSVDYSKADYLEYGKGNGCDFFSESCENPDDYIEFCKEEGDWGCDLGGDKKASCMANTFGNGCLVW